MSKKELKKSKEEAPVKKTVFLKLFDFLTTYLSTPSPSGFELDAQRVFLKKAVEYLNPERGDYASIDNMQNGIVLVKSRVENPLKVAIVAHADEIGMKVEGYKGDYLAVSAIGGLDIQSCLGRRVEVLTDKGIVEGVTTSLPPHLLKKQFDDIKDIYVDLGLPSTELKKVVKIGNPIVFKQDIFIMNDDRIVAKALDNKICGYSLIRVLKTLHDEDIELPFDLYLVNCAGEEIGKKGSTYIAKKLKADLSIVLDVGHDNTIPHITPKNVSGIGEGILVNEAPMLHRNLVRFIEHVASKNKHSYKKRVKGRTTGTDADAFFEESEMTALIQIPIKYMHSTKETASRADILTLSALLVDIITELPQNFLSELSYSIEGDSEFNKKYPIIIHKPKEEKDTKNKSSKKSNVIDVEKLLDIPNVVSENIHSDIASPNLGAIGVPQTAPIGTSQVEYTNHQDMQVSEQGMQVGEVQESEEQDVVETNETTSDNPLKAFIKPSDILNSAKEVISTIGNAVKIETTERKKVTKAIVDKDKIAEELRKKLPNQFTPKAVTNKSVDSDDYDDYDD